MAKRKRTKREMLQNHEVMMWPVTADDKWCRFKSRLTREQINSQAPYGYVIVIPYYYDHMRLDIIDGSIVKCRLFKGELYLQVVSNGDLDKDYATLIKVSENCSKKRKSKKQKYLNIRNYNKQR